MKVTIKADFSQVRDAASAARQLLTNLNPLTNNTSRQSTERVWTNRITILELNSDMRPYNPDPSVEVLPEQKAGMGLEATYANVHPDLVEADDYYGRILDFSDAELELMFDGHFERLQEI